jgi:DNA-binding CsgD family transcriptional regulator
MTVAEDLVPFVGRAAEVEALRSEVAIVRSGVPRIVIVQGGAGSGKTALIENVLTSEVDLAVLWTSGEPWEVSVANGVIDQLMCVAEIDAARPVAVRGRYMPPEEPNVVGARILDVLSGLERETPVVVVVDDAQWADMDSLRALLFAARRLARQRMLMMFGQRSEDAHRLPTGLHRLAGGRTGTTVTLCPIPAAEAHRLAALLAVRGLSGRAAQRSGTLDGPTMLTKPADRRPRPWDPSLRAAQVFAMHVQGRLDSCSHPTQTFVEALIVLGTTDPSAAGIVAGVPDLAAALSEASSAELLHVRGDFGICAVDFAHPLVPAAVYERLGPARRLQLHSAATAFVDADELLLRRRLLAATSPDPRLAAELEAFARREITVGAWATGAWALVESSRLCPEPELWQQRLLRTVDATIDAVDQPQVFARHVQLFTSSAWRDAALGYLSVLRGKGTEAEELLGKAWRQCAEARPVKNGDAAVAATVAQRMALHELGRLRGDEVEGWSRRAIAMTRPGDPTREEAEALLGLGIAWQGRIDEGMAIYEAMLSRINPAADGPQLARIQMAHSWLWLIRGDVVAARDSLAETAPAALRAGAVQIAVWSFSLLALAEFTTGLWDEARTHADRAVSLLDQAGMEWLRPLARYAAVLVPAARGEWEVAEVHLRGGAAEADDYELMVVAAARARAHVGAARGEHEDVLRSLKPFVLRARAEIVEPGLWPCPDLYIDALVSVGKLAEADELLGSFELLAAARGHTAMLARLARPRGRLLAARGQLTDAEHTFKRALTTLGELSMPFQQAQVELTYGQALRRAGRRRAAATKLQAAGDRFRELRATPYLRHCEREMSGCGLTPAKRGDVDPHRLTPQEQAVTRLVALGMSNRQVAAELFVSVKTVQFHLTHIYTKLGVGSRAELAAQYRE